MLEIKAIDEIYLFETEDDDIAQVAISKADFMADKLYIYHEPNEETMEAIEESLNPETLIECEDFNDMLKKCELKCCA